VGVTGAGATGDGLGLDTTGAGVVGATDAVFWVCWLFHQKKPPTPAAARNRTAINSSRTVTNFEDVPVGAATAGLTFFAAG
jgi:hypothetical protein